MIKNLESLTTDNFFKLRREDFIPIIGAIRYIKRANRYYRNCNISEKEVIGNNDETRTRYAGLLFYNIFLLTPAILTIGHFLTK